MVHQTVDVTGFQKLFRSLRLPDFALTFMKLTAYSLLRNCLLGLVSPSA
jgi:hypothetical protein